MKSRAPLPSLLGALVLLSACAGSDPKATASPAPDEPGADDPGDPTSASYVDPLEQPARAAEASASRPTKPADCETPQECASKGASAVLGANPGAGLPMLEYACAQDVVQACADLSTAMRSGRVPGDPIAARRAAARGCDLGSATACVDLGVDEHTGSGGDKDSGSALARFEGACESKDGMGCRFAGVLHHEGATGTRDHDRAMEFFVAGCAEDDATSGEALVDEYLRRACDLGDEPACRVQGQRAEAAQPPLPGPPEPAGANLRVGSATVDGLTVEDFACRVEGGGLGLLGSAAVIGSLAKKKRSLDKCGEKGERVRVAWTAKGGRITKASGEGKSATCVAKLLAKLESPVTGDCVANFVLGE